MVLLFLFFSNTYLEIDDADIEEAMERLSSIYESEDWLFWYISFCSANLS
jgi:hypothetical protein